MRKGKLLITAAPTLISPMFSLSCSVQ